MKDNIKFNKLKATCNSLGIDTRNCNDIESLRKKYQMAKLNNIILKIKEKLLKKRIESEELEQIKKEISKFAKASDKNRKILN